MPVVGEQVEEFELFNQDGDKIRLGDYRGRKVIVFAFPKADASASDEQALAFRDAMPDIIESNAVVFGIGVEEPHELAAWKAQLELNFDLLSDPTHEVLSAWDAWGEMELKGRRFEAPIRSYWVINESGMVIDAQVRVTPADSVRQAMIAVEERHLRRKA